MKNIKQSMKQHMKKSAYSTEDKKEFTKKRGAGRPTKSHVVTKLSIILKKRNIKITELHSMIKEKYPDGALSLDAVSRIVSGSRNRYNTTTLYKICGTLNISPNMALALGS